MSKGTTSGNEKLRKARERHLLNGISEAQRLAGWGEDQDIVERDHEEGSITVKFYWQGREPFIECGNGHRFHRGSEVYEQVAEDGPTECPLCVKDVIDELVRERLGEEAIVDLPYPPSEKTEW